jgi:hypothetical protein
MSALHCNQLDDRIRPLSAPGPDPSQTGDQFQGAPVPDQSPSQPGDQIRDFFDLFTRASGSLDLDALAGCFDETFLSSDAAGTRVVPRPAFVQALAGRAQMFADAGIGRAALRQLTYQELDLHHVLASTTWAAPRTDGSGEVTLASSFLLRRDGDQLRIVVYINHQGLPS